MRTYTRVEAWFKVYSRPQVNVCGGVCSVSKVLGSFLCADSAVSVGDSLRTGANCGFQRKVAGVRIVLVIFESSFRVCKPHSSASI